MTNEARELELYITNDGRLYKQMMLPIYKNLATKMAAGSFNLDLGIRAFKYVVDEGAKRYTLEHGSMTDKWSVLFPPESRARSPRRSQTSSSLSGVTGNSAISCRRSTPAFKSAIASRPSRANIATPARSSSSSAAAKAPRRAFAGTRRRRPTSTILSIS